MYFSLSSIYIVLAMGLGNLSAFWVRTAKVGQFSFRPIQKLDPPIVGRPNPYRYHSAHVFCQDWIDLSVPISISGCWVILFMVAF